MTFWKEQRKQLFPPTNTTDKAVFTILMTNDVYDIAPNYDGLGGLANLTTLIKREKAKILNHDKNCIVTLNGDFLSASSLAVKYKGAHMIDLLNSVGVEYIVPGNHEFDFGSEVVRERITESKFTWLCANIYEADGTDELLKGCIRKKILTVDGFRIGLFGVCTKDTITLSSPGKSVVFASVVETTKQLVKELRETDNCDVVIALTHLSIAEDRELARTVHGIDVMLGGHDHTPHSQTQGHTFIHKAGVDAQYLARIKLYMEKKVTIINEKRIEKVKVFPEWKMILNRNIEPDPEVNQKVNKYLDELPQDNVDEIGITETPLDSCTESVRSKETSFGNLTTDAIRETFDADIAMFNGGGIRGDRSYDAGSRITKGDIRKEFPFPNGAGLATITGKVLWATAEAGLARAEQKLGSFPHFSKNVHIVYDVNKEPGHRIEQFEFNGVPIDPDKTYNFATTVYLLGGGDGYGVLKEHTPIEHPLNGIAIGEIVMNYIARHQIISAKKEGRVYLNTKKKQASF